MMFALQPQRNCGYDPNVIYNVKGFIPGTLIQNPKPRVCWAWVQQPDGIPIAYGITPNGTPIKRSKEFIFLARSPCKTGNSCEGPQLGFASTSLVTARGVAKLQLWRAQPVQSSPSAHKREQPSRNNKIRSFNQQSAKPSNGSAPPLRAYSRKHTKIEGMQKRNNFSTGSHRWRCRSDPGLMWLALWVFHLYLLRKMSIQRQSPML